MRTTIACMPRNNRTSTPRVRLTDPPPDIVKLSRLAAFSPPAAIAKSLIHSLRSSGTLSQNGRIMLNLTTPYWELGWAALVGYFVDKGSEGTEALYLSGTN